MSGVYNRKLFRQTSARDELRRMGGIMASSEELLQEAMRTADRAPMPSDMGPMQPPARPAMPQPMMAPPMQPMMGQPMMGQPMMAAPMQPMQPMMAGPAFMPPQVPMSAQMPMAPAAPPAAPGYAGGGFVVLPGMLDEPKIDVTKPAGTVVEPPKVELDEDVIATAEDLAGRVDSEDPEKIGGEIVDAAGKRGADISGDLQTDLAGIYANLTGDPAAYEKNIDALNRGIIGAAIAAGTSPRATENIAKGMMVGLEAARETEERRVRDARALQLAQLQARAAEARGGAGGVGSRDYRNPVDAYQDAYQSVMNAGEFDLQIPEGMTREDYADQVATDLILRSYTPDQLVGTPFEGVGGAAPRPTGGTGATQTEADVLQSAREAIAAGADEAAVRERLQSMGIDPGAL